MTQPIMPPQSNMMGFNPPPHQPFSGPGILSNPMLQMAMAMYLPGQVGQGNFLPQLTPSQHLFDQHNAMQYQNARMQGMAGIQDIDQQAMTANFLRMRSGVTDTPATAMNVQQASNFAGMLNHPVARMFASQILGPETMEDMFYGQRGSAENLYQSVARTGFFRKDTLGGDRMTAESLGGVTREMFTKMYGPDADIGEMNGISAGRAGMLYEDLFRRGALPKSLGQMSAADRVKLIGQELPDDDETLTRLSREYSREKLTANPTELLDGKTFAELSRPQQEVEIDKVESGNKKALKRTLDTARAGGTAAKDVEEMAGFSTMARSVDADRITKTLKDHTGAVAAVREIFGEAGNPNAPFGQLLTALEALTQNQVGRADPKKVEKSVREVQMAARGAGVGLQGMLGLSAQAAAYGDQFGLHRSLALESTTTGLNMAAAMRETGAFDRGFGSMTPEEAALRGIYTAQSAKASPTANMLYATRRSVTENRDQHYDADGKAKTAAAAMLEAMDAGNDTFVDPTSGKTVSIKEGKRSGDFTGFLRNQLDKSQDSSLTNSILLDTQGNQAFADTFSNMSGMTQRDDIIGMLGRQAANQITTDDETISVEDANKLGEAEAVAMLDATRGRLPDGTLVTPANRNKVFMDSIRKQLTEQEELRLSDPTSPDHIVDEDARKLAAETSADALITKRYKTGDDLGEMISKTIADRRRGIQAIGNPMNMTTDNVIDMFNKEAQDYRAKKMAEDSARAGRMGEFGSAQSSILARARDVLVEDIEGKSVADLTRTILNVLPADYLKAADMPGAEAVVSGAVHDFKHGDAAGRERSGAIFRGISEGGGDALQRGVRADAERMLGIKAGTATDADSADIEELAKSLLAGEKDNVAYLLEARGITDDAGALTDARASADWYGKRSRDRRGLGGEKTTAAMVADRQKVLREIVTTAEADKSGKTMQDLKDSPMGEKLIELAKTDDMSVLERELSGADALAMAKFKDLTTEGTSLVQDTEAGKKVKGIVKKYNETEEEAATAAAAASAAAAGAPGAAVGDLASAVTKASPAIDSVTKAADAAAEALGKLPTVIALIGPEKIVEVAADTVSKGATAAGTPATPRGASSTIMDAVQQAGETAMSGVLQLVGLDKVLLNGRGSALEQTPGNAAGVHTGPVTAST